MYASKATASHMRWHAKHHTEDGEIIHPSNAQAWWTLNDMHPDFALETRNVWLGLCVLMVLTPLEVRGNNIHRGP